MRTRALILPFFVLSLVLLAVSCTTPVEQLPTPSLQALPYVPPTNETPQPVLYEQRLIQLEWPRRIREGDSDLIVLSIIMDEQGNLTPTVPADDITPVEIPNLYETHNIVAVARLDMAGLEAYRDEIREPLRPGRPVAFRWSIRAGEAGQYRGVIWLHLEMVPKAGGPTERTLLLARTLDIEAVTVFGMSGTVARIFGVGGLILSTALGYPFIQRMLESWWKRLKRQPPPPPSSPPLENEGGD